MARQSSQVTQTKQQRRQQNGRRSLERPNHDHLIASTNAQQQQQPLAPLPTLLTFLEGVSRRLGHLLANEEAGSLSPPARVVETRQWTGGRHSGRPASSGRKCAQQAASGRAAGEQQLSGWTLAGQAEHKANGPQLGVIQANGLQIQQLTSGQDQPSCKNNIYNDTQASLASAMFTYDHYAPAYLQCPQPEIARIQTQQVDSSSLAAPQPPTQQQRFAITQSSRACQQVESNNNNSHPINCHLLDAPSLSSSNLGAVQTDLASYNQLREGVYPPHSHDGNTYRHYYDSFAANNQMSRQQQQLFDQTRIAAEYQSADCAHCACLAQGSFLEFSAPAQR